MSGVLSTLRNYEHNANNTKKVGKTIQRVFKTICSMILLRVADNYTTTANSQYVAPTLLEGEVKSKHLVTIPYFKGY